jgi:Chromosome segregation ATPases
MSYSGSTLYRKISGFRSELESNISTLTARNLDLSKRSRQLLSKQAELWASLANIHLDLGFDLPKEILALVERRKDRLENQQNIVATGESRILELTEQHKAREDELSLAQKEFDEHEAVLKEKFEADAEAMALSVTVSGLKSSVEDKRERLARVEAECSSKVEAYENDELFLYLRKRGFGTEGYSSTGIIARLDHWVSRLVNYDKASADYEHLLKIPGWHRDDLEQSDARLVEMSNKLDEVQKKAFATLVPYKNKLRAAGKALDAAAEAIADEHHKIAAAQRTLSEASIAQDDDLKKIKRELANALERINIRDLQELAKRTDTKEDDVIVQKIIQNRNDLADIESQSNKFAREIAGLKQRAKEFETIESKMRRKSWHHSDHSFSGSMDTHLANMLLGVVTADAVWRAMSNAHRDPAPSYRESVSSSPWPSSGSSWSSSSSSSSDWGSSSSSWGSSSSDYSTGGGSGGGDYSTGGGV